MALRKGYVSVGGASRRVRTPSGEVISHRQYRNKLARKAGFPSLSTEEKFRSGKGGASKALHGIPRITDAEERRKFLGDVWKVENSPRGRSIMAGRKADRTSLGRWLIRKGIIDSDHIWTEASAEASRR